jgi:hypothetical protein
MTVLAVVMLVVGGIEYMSTVSVGEKEGAKSRITNALLGLVLALGSYAILNTLNPNLVNLNISIDSADVSVNENILDPTSGGGKFTGGGASPNVDKNITDYDVLLKQASEKNAVDCVFAKAIMYAESKGNPKATSSAGAIGLMQLMPKTFQSMGFDVSKMTDPATSIEAGVKYISTLQSNGCNGTKSNDVCTINVQGGTVTAGLDYLAAAYNGGGKTNAPSIDCKDSTRWQCLYDDAGHTKPNTGYQETRNYTIKVAANYNKLKASGWDCGK